MYDIIIIGGGPAGLTAGIYTARARLKTLLIDNYGIDGQLLITDLVENFPGFSDGISGSDLLSKMRVQLAKFEGEVASDEVIAINKKGNCFEIKTAEKNYETASIIIATGGRPRALEVPGECELIGAGVSYCATCDAALFRNKIVFVAGGGDTAIEEALFLTKFAEKVFVVHRRDKLRATKILQERIFSNKKIEIIWSSVITKITGEKKVEGVEIKNVATKETKNIKCDGVFVFVGYNPNTSFLSNLVQLDEGGYIITDDTMKTNINGVFACGDCRKKMLRQVVTAASDGATAAISAEKYIEGLKEI